jgi:hypothetical protein
VCSELSGGVYLSALTFQWDKEEAQLTSKGNVIEVVGSLDSLDFTTNVKLFGLVVEVRDGGVGIVIGTHDVDSLKLLVGGVDVVD